MTPPAVALGIMAPIQGTGDVAPTTTFSDTGGVHEARLSHNRFNQIKAGEGSRGALEAPPHAGVPTREAPQEGSCSRCCNCNRKGMCGDRSVTPRRHLYEVSAADASLVSSVAALLQHLAMQRSSEGCGAPCFLSATEPVISVPDYLERLARFFQCSRECFVLALVYIDRLLQMNAHVWLCPLNLHRLAVTALMVAVKFSDDTFYSNAYYAKVGGLPLKEMNHLEATLLRMLQFRLHVLPWEFHKYLRLVLKSPFSAAAYRTKAVGWASGALAHPQSGGVAAGEPSREEVACADGCKRGQQQRQQPCCNACCSPSFSGSTGYSSGSSQSISPPSTPEATVAKSPEQQHIKRSKSSSWFNPSKQFPPVSPSTYPQLPA
ncbi:cyclin-P2-1 [Cyclospora cayetanensis]|uniref:Cyclin-P2-1 n=1 Tax=Cyclospora cayetanensis TaxID=88456 RepID=A0A6P5WE06_9EIME|nr:cyclin-P2-1 [Cyclospora cayetanensis]